MYRRNHARLGAKAFGRKEMSICSTTQEQSRQRLRVFRQFWFFFVVIMVFLAYRNRAYGQRRHGTDRRASHLRTHLSRLLWTDRRASSSWDPFEATCVHD
uniref:Uncharacterized protein n=1 Tax=Cacopsylla melanoneura TaxID=428564 RepID=A0A8D8T8C4_9HEMI